MTDLLQSENLLPLLLRHLHAGVVIHAADTRILFANEHAAQILGLSSDQLNGKTSLDPAWTFLREDGSPMPPEEYPIRRVLSTRQPLQDLVIGVDRPATQDRIWAIINAFPEFPEREDPGRIVVTFVDITERKRAEDHLRSISRMQSIILDNSTVGITLVRNRVQVWANPRMAELFGLPLERLQGISTRLLYPDDASFDMVATQAYPLLAQGQKAVFEIQMKKGDGSLFWCHFEGNALDPAHPQDGSIWICADITERKRAEEQLQHLSRLQSTILDNSTIGIALVRNRVFEWVNPRMAELFGLPRERLQGSSTRIIYPDEASYERHGAAAYPLLAQGQKAALEAEMRKGDGSTFWCRLEGKALDAATPMGVSIWIWEDITERKRAETDIRSAKAFLDSVIDMSPIATWIAGKDGTVTRVNRSLCEAIHLPPEQIVGSYSVLHDANLEAQGVMPLVKAVFDERKPAHFSIPWKATDAGKVDFHGARDLFIDVSMFPVLDAQGELSHVVCQWMDITERKRTEKALQQLSRTQTTILDNSTVGITLVRHRVFEWVNPRMAELFRFPLERLQGAPTRIIYPDDASYQRISDLYPLLARGEKLSIELELLRGDGTRFWCRLGGKAVDPAHPLDGTIWIAEDFTERKRAEEALRESEERFRTLVDHAPEGIFVHADGFIRFVNPAMARLLGASGPQNLVDVDFLCWVAPEFHDAVRERVRLQRDTGAPAPPMAMDFLRLDGSRISVETVAVPFRFQDRAAHLVFVRDITARRKVELQRETLQTQLQQAQKMDSVGRLAGGVAHDFNNMLGVILGHAELALAQIDPSLPFFADLQEIQKAAARSADLTRQLLAFARKQTVAPKILDLNETVEGMLKMLRRLIGENIDLAWHPGKNPDRIQMDPSQIDQILANLCVNARDAIDETGKITIETDNATFDDEYCAAHPGFSPGAFVLLAVSDDGCGMDSDTLLHLFEPFFTTKKVGEGTGLGLATVYGIVKQNQGFINVYSEMGQGTTFKIYLPRHAPADSPAPPPQPPKPISRGSETILLVEDEPQLLNMTRMMLEHAGYRVLSATSPAEALRLAEEHADHVHLLMTDVVMPEMNGRELARALHTRQPHLKCLFMSGYTANVIAHHGILDPGVHFIQKPFSTADLAAKIREALDAPLPPT